VPKQLTHNDVEAAIRDLKHRTLSRIGFTFARLIYLASTRDYNTGCYYHDGLAFQFSEEVARQALAETHREVFRELALSPLQDLTQELQLYLESAGPEPEDIVRGWEKLEAYRVVIPIDAEPLTASLFLANVKLALPIVESRLRGDR